MLSAFGPYSRPVLLTFTICCCLNLLVDSSKLLFAIPSPSSTTKVDGACTIGQVGLIAPMTGKWTNCMDASWSNDAETASFLEDGTVAVYAAPGGGDDTYFVHVDFSKNTTTKVIVGGDQGNLRCTPKGICFGVVPGDGNDPTQLMRVNSKTGASKSALALHEYIGYSVDGAVINPDTGLYYAILVGKVHGGDNGTDKSNQWLCTFNVTGEGAATILSEIPVSSDFMGPLMSTSRVEVMTFGSDTYDGLVSIDRRTGRETKMLGGFGTVFTFSAAFDRTSIAAVNIYPSPLRLFVVKVLDDKKTAVVTNVTFGESVHALAASWA